MAFNGYVVWGEGDTFRAFGPPLDLVDPKRVARLLGGGVTNSFRGYLEQWDLFEQQVANAALLFGGERLNGALSLLVEGGLERVLGM